MYALLNNNTLDGSIFFSPIQSSTWNMGTLSEILKDSHMGETQQHNPHMSYSYK